MSLEKQSEAEGGLIVHVKSADSWWSSIPVRLIKTQMNRVISFSTLENPDNSQETR